MLFACLVRLLDERLMKMGLALLLFVAVAVFAAVFDTAVVAVVLASWVQCLLVQCLLVC